jgi:hypothetical protein
MRRNRGVIALALVVFVLVTGVVETRAVIVAAPAGAMADLPAPSWWNGSDCDDAHYFAATGVHTHRLGATFLGVPACGPSPFVGGGTDVLWTHAGWGEYDFECTELAFRFMYLAYGITNAWQANGNNVVRNYTAAKGGGLQVINNGTANAPPLPGDVISFDNPNNVGHVAVVSSASVDGNGNGSITLLTQNDTANGSRTLTVTGWNVQGFGNNTPYGWLRKPGWWNTTPPPPMTHGSPVVQRQDGIVDVFGVCQILCVSGRDGR